MNTVEYKEEIYNIETIYVYDELISIYKGNLLETKSIKVKLSEVKILALFDVSKKQLKEAEQKGYDKGHFDALMKMVKQRFNVYNGKCV